MAMWAEGSLQKSVLLAPWTLNCRGHGDEVTWQQLLAASEGGKVSAQNTAHPRQKSAACKVITLWQTKMHRKEGEGQRKGVIIPMKIVSLIRFLKNGKGVF